MTLQPLYKAPPPIYAHPVFVAEVGDAFLEGTGMDGGSLVSSIAVMSLVVERLNRSASSPNGFEIPTCEETTESKNLSALTFEKLGLTHDDLQAINYLSEALKQSKSLFHRFGMAQKNGLSQLIHFMKHFKSKLGSLSEGGLLLVPGGVNDASYVYIVERQDANRFRFSVFNADPEGGLSFHASTASIPNKLKYQNVFSVNDISAERIMDDAFWGMLFKLAVHPDPKFNTPSKIYAWLLPFLVDKPTDHILSESVMTRQATYRTPPRSNTGFLRCIIEASMYILRTRGLSNRGCSIYLFLLRVQLVEFALQDTNFVPYLRGSDRSVLRIAASQLAYAAVKLGGGNVGEKQSTDALKAVADCDSIQPKEESVLSCTALDDIKDMVEALLSKCDTDRLLDKSETSLINPRKMILTSDSVSNTAMGSLFYPFADRLVRLEDVNGLAGAPVVQPKYVPVDFLQ